MEIKFDEEKVVRELERKGFVATSSHIAARYIARWQHTQDLAAYQKLEAKCAELEARCEKLASPEFENYLKHELQTERAKSSKLIAVMEEVKRRLGCCMLTGFPVNVRELDGSISQHRPRTNEGEAYDLISKTLAEIEEKK